MNLKEYNRLTDLFGKLNSRENTEDEFAAMSEGEKLKFFWKDCMPEKIDASSIIEKTQQKIKRDAMRRRRNYFLVASASIAASVLICISTIYFLNQTGEEKQNFQAMVEQMENSAIDEVTLITSKEQLNLDENAFIKYTKEGKVAVNSQKVEEEKEEGGKVAELEEYDQLLVPAGKRAKIELSDGTLVTVNSQSKVIYPRRFKGETRTIYAQGEVFLEVAHDKKHPFIVKTSLLSVRALGTKFNIQAYSEDRKTITTLENGKVQINNLLAPDSCFILTPGEQLEYNHLTKNYEKRKIDVMMASGWTRGELNFVDCHLEDILNTLGRHYNVEIKAEPHLYTNDLYTIKLRKGEPLQAAIHIVTMTVGGMESKVTDNKVVILTAASPANKSKKGGTHP